MNIDKLKELTNLTYENVLSVISNDKDTINKLLNTRNTYLNDGTESNILGRILMMIRGELKVKKLNELFKSLEGKKIYIASSNNSFDCISSIYLLTNILKFFDIKAFPVSNSLDFDDSINDYIDIKFKKVRFSSKKNILLVNSINSEYKNVIAIIDNSENNDFNNNILSIKYTSCSLFIYDLFKDLYEFNDLEKEIISLSVLFESDFLLKNYNYSDRELFDSISDNLDIEELKNKYFKMTDLSYSISHNLKERLIIKEGIKVSTIHSNNAEYKKYFDKYYKYIKESKSKYMLIWCNHDKNETMVIYNKKKSKLNYLTCDYDEILKNKK